MRRQRRKRTTRRRGLQHIGDVLSMIMTDLDQDEAQEAGTTKSTESPGGLPVTATGTTDTQNTFSFYQPVEV